MRNLTPRETDVLTLIARGRSNKEIAVALCITLSTVKGHCSDIYDKLDVYGRVSASMMAVRMGLVTP